ncbi:glutathione S-transferase [Lutimaribacter marinistellae]|uniref:Glutathione S-transferase n=1 Tax=Lutimaribacter marinistellae TaxID=1820329 RepID=A0ABV7TC40_9RHOB
MPERFTLYYWPIPFRAQFARYILAHAGQPWTEPDRDAVMALYQTDIAEQPVPFMGPPVLQDAEHDAWISQAPAICSYLGEELDLMPGDPVGDAMTRKVLGDCIDVLHALTRNCGDQMWTQESWNNFAAHRLPRWLQIFEDLGRRNGLGAEHGTLLGTPSPGVADLACSALWVTIVDTLPALEGTISDHAPNVLALSRRLAAAPAITRLRAEQAERWGDVWCEGQIEASLRSVLADWAG